MSIRGGDEWLDRARQDLRAVPLLLGDDLIAGAAFHAQQAIEKILKSFLAATGTAIPHIHDLEALRLRQPGLACPVADEDLATISSWVVLGRYPGMDEQLPSREEIERVSKITDQWIARIGQG